MKIIMLRGLPASGKGQPKNSIIPTPNGDKKIGDLQVGDYVFGSNGKPTKVLGVFPRGVLPVYKVNFADGSELVVDGDHIWTFEGRKSRRNGEDGYVRYNYTTKELYANIALVSPKSRGMTKKHLPIVAPLEYTDERVDIDPYVLGLYLADGSCGDNGVPRITKKEPGVVEYMLQLADAPHNKHQYGKNTSYYTYPKGGNKLWPYLQKTGLVSKKSSEKFIPEEMFYKSAEVRKRLLYGLMDGDGSIRKRTSKSRIAVYSTTSERLKNDIIRLVCSLGGTTLASLRDINRRAYWEIRIYTEFNPFLATHEVEEWEKRKYRQNTYRTIESIEKAGYDEVICIAVEAPDQLYVADTQHYIVTHNTTWAKEQARNGSYMVLSKDTIRDMLGGYNKKREKQVVKIRNRLIETALESKLNVIIDDTNLNPIHERTISQIAKKTKAKLEINDSFLKVSPDECIRRDMKRGEKSVGASAIWAMYYKWIVPNTLKKLQKDFDKPRCIICDIDGTLAHNVKGRDIYDLSRVHEDVVDPFVGFALDAFANYGMELNGKPYPEIILLTGRFENSREVTEQWLSANMIPYDKLIMKKDGDTRSDVDFKKSVYAESIAPNYGVLVVFEDRPCCSRMWRELGLKVADMGNPYVDF